MSSEVTSKQKIISISLLLLTTNRSTSNSASVQIMSMLRITCFTIIYCEEIIHSHASEVKAPTVSAHPEKMVFFRYKKAIDPNLHKTACGISVRFQMATCERFT